MDLIYQSSPGEGWTGQNTGLGGKSGTGSMLWVTLQIVTKAGGSQGVAGVC